MTRSSRTPRSSRHIPIQPAPFSPGDIITPISDPWDVFITIARPGPPHFTVATCVPGTSPSTSPTGNSHRARLQLRELLLDFPHHSRYADQYRLIAHATPPPSPSAQEKSPTS